MSAWFVRGLILRHYCVTVILERDKQKQQKTRHPYSVTASFTSSKKILINE